MSNEIYSEDELSAEAIYHMKRGGIYNFATDLDNMIEVKIVNHQVKIVAVIDKKKADSFAVNRNTLSPEVYALIASQNNALYYDWYAFINPKLYPVPMHYIVPKNEHAIDYFKKCRKIVSDGVGYWLTEYQYFSMIFALKQQKPACCYGIKSKHKHICKDGNCKQIESHIWSTEYKEYKIPM